MPGSRHRQTQRNVVCSQGFCLLPMPSRSAAKSVAPQTLKNAPCRTAALAHANSTQRGLDANVESQSCSRWLAGLTPPYLRLGPLVPEIVQGDDFLLWDYHITQRTTLCMAFCREYILFWARQMFSPGKQTRGFSWVFLRCPGGFVAGFLLACGP